MGENKWGQLGIDPFKDNFSTFHESLQKLSINAFGENDYPIQVECGYNHTIILVENLVNKERSIV